MSPFSVAVDVAEGDHDAVGGTEGRIVHDLPVSSEAFVVVLVDVPDRVDFVVVVVLDVVWSFWGLTSSKMK